jgi:hypothetical protein
MVIGNDNAGSLVYASWVAFGVWVGWCAAAETTPLLPKRGGFLGGLENILQITRKE